MGISVMLRGFLSMMFKLETEWIKEKVLVLRLYVAKTLFLHILPAQQWIINKGLQALFPEELVMRVLM